MTTHTDWEAKLRDREHAASMAIYHLISERKLDTTAWRYVTRNLPHVARQVEKFLVEDAALFDIEAALGDPARLLADGSPGIVPPHILDRIPGHEDDQPTHHTDRSVTHD